MPRSIGVMLALIPALAACGDNLRIAPPELAVVFDNTPSAISNQTHVVVAFHVDGAPAQTLCGIDRDAAAPCTSPFEADVTDGGHAIVVAAIPFDAAVAPTNNTYAWLVDSVAPDTQITQAPAAVHASDSSSFTFTTTDADVDHFECAVDAALFARCSSPATFTLGDGSHTFAVRAVDAAGNADPTPAEVSWVVDTAGPAISITRGPEGATPDPTPSWAFTVTGDPVSVQCRIDDAAFADCSASFTSPALANGPHTFDIQALDAAGNLATVRRAFTLDTTSCGNGVRDAGNGEVCDGADLGGQTCASTGHPSGTLACAADCGGFDTSGCTGGYTAAATRFTGTPCFDGLRYSTPNLTLPYVLACTEHDGVFKTKLDTPITWTNTTASGVAQPNPNGRAVAVNPNGPPVYYVSDTLTAMNGFRSNNGGDSWTAQSLSNAGTLYDVFAFIFRQSIGNIAGSWDPAAGAIVLHGNQPTSMVPHFVGPTPGSVTGTVRAIANGGAKDVYVAVYGQTPAGAPASGGIFRACDLTMTGGGTYTERDTGIAFADRPRVWSLTVDPSSIVSTPFPCGDSTSSGSANTYYAALRGGGQIYQTTDGGASWTQRNTGLPAGAEVYAIAIDCYSISPSMMCRNANLLYAATSAGLYKSTDAGAHWTIDGFEGQVVRAVAIHPTASPLQMLVGVDDAVGIYQGPPAGP